MKFKSPKTETRQEKRVERILTDVIEKHILILDKTGTHNVLLCM
jgi:hypothetical protein